MQTQVYNIISMLTERFVVLSYLKFTGMMITTVTYDNRLHISMVARLKCLNNRSELQEILDGIFTFVDKLQGEVNELKHM